MKAVLQNFRSGQLSVSEIPPPLLKPGGVLFQNAASLVSAGTEKAVIELAKMNPLDKAKARPDLVKKVLSKAGQEGWLGTARMVMNLVNNPLPLGYSCAGIVKAVGEGVSDIHAGDRIACAGLGHANHAESVFVPRNLAAPIPKGVEFEEAAFVTVGAIAMQGVRQANPTIGESVVVIGLGLVGQLAAQICQAAGCNVFGIDLDPAKVKLALTNGVKGTSSPSKEEIIEAVRTFTSGRGADAIIITAATPSNEPIELAAELARDRGRVVVVGDVGFNIPRRPYYEKELDIRLSRSYGPGRYDSSYEEKGNDYPIGYVRWTENRNMEAFLDLVAQKKVNITPLVTHRFPIESAHKAYDLLGGKAREPYIGILLQYDLDRAQPARVDLKTSARPVRQDTISFGVIGAGQFAQAILLPHLNKMSHAKMSAVVTGTGVTAKTIAEKYGCRFCASDHREILQDEKTQAVIIATRHDLHALMVVEALSAGKHVFVEKPLAITPQELSQIADTTKELRRKKSGLPVLMVGYNRRFSPLARRLKQAFSDQPITMSYRVNAGSVPADHWTQDPKEGGGRIVGEACHFVDLMQYLTGSEPVEVFAWAAGGGAAGAADPDNVTTQIRFANGSVGTIFYVADGDKSFPKERIEVFGGGKVGVIDNWRSVEIHDRGHRVQRKAIMSAEKGHAEELAAFVEGVRAGHFPIPLESLFLTTQTTFAIQQAHRTGRPVTVVSSLP
jgi:predicted dehydrogenase/threonine dehydrogenase-like Zn-dependent dehydrogenase